MRRQSPHRKRAVCGAFWELWFFKERHFLACQDAAGSGISRSRVACPALPRRPSGVDMAGGAKKQVRFARLEEDGAPEAGALGDAAAERAAAGESPPKGLPGSSARLALQPVVKVADGSGRRSRAGGGLGVGKQQAAAVAASRRALKWCISAALCAAFLGLVRRRESQASGRASRAARRVTAGFVLR